MTLKRPPSRLVTRDQTPLSATLEVAQTGSGQITLRRYAATEAAPYWDREKPALVCSLSMFRDEATALRDQLTRLLAAG